MTGFEDHQPSQWKQGVFNAPLPPRPRTQKRQRRLDGEVWITKSTLAIALPAGAVTSTTVRIDLPTGATGIDRGCSEAAPAGYFEKLQRAMAGAPRLPEQPKDGDPEFSF